MVIAGVDLDRDRRDSCTSCPPAIGGLIVARLFLGAGEGMVYTAGSAWVVDLAPPDRRGRIIGLYGLAIWGGLSLGPPIGELILHATSFEGVWAFAAGAPLLGALIATRIPERYEPRPLGRARRPALDRARGAAPGLGLALAIVGYATVAAFIVLHLDERQVGHGAGVFTAFAVSVVAMRVLGGWLPDRFGSIPCAIGAALLEAGGLLADRRSPTRSPRPSSARSRWAPASRSCSRRWRCVVINRVPEERRGAAMGTFTAFFDLGVGIGSPIAGAAAALGGYEAAFLVAAGCALATVFVALSLRATLAALPDPAPAPRP